uniref:Uncharacterized protein n=1 Tax=Panagrolaimus superbus TaxID=310955 RepID=A0A914YYV9_9BILA
MRPCAVFASNSQTNVPAVICTPPGSAPVRAIIVEEDDDKASTISHAPSVHSVIDDVPKTPKKPSSWFDPTNAVSRLWNSIKNLPPCKLVFVVFLHSLKILNLL